MIAIYTSDRLDSLLSYTKCVKYLDWLDFVFLPLLDAWCQVKDIFGMKEHLKFQMTSPEEIDPSVFAFFCEICTCPLKNAEFKTQWASFPKFMRRSLYNSYTLTCFYVYWRQPPHLTLNSRREAAIIIDL